MKMVLKKINNYVYKVSLFETTITIIIFITLNVCVNNKQNLLKPL